MRTIPSNNLKTLSIDRFSGVDARTVCTDPTGSSDIINLVPQHDGSLKKRCGFSLLAALSYNVRRVWTGEIGGVNLAYILAGKYVYSYIFSSKTLTQIGTVNTTDTDADFFCYGGSVYLVDGASIYTVSDGTLTRPLGYVPLVGKDWSDTYIGEPYEPRNLLNNKGRISYVMSEEPSTFLKTDEPISSIDAVYVNGVLIDSSRYTITEMPRTVSVSGLSAFDRVEMYFTYSEDTDPTALAALFSCTSAIVFGGATNERPFLWGSDDRALMFSSRYVGTADTEASRRVYETSNSLYFPKGYEFKVGDGQSPIRAVSKHYDRLLIFTDGGTWMANSSACGTDAFPTLSINSVFGASAPHAATLLGNNPYTVSHGTILKWSSNTDMLDECNASSVSDAINPLLPDKLFSDAVIFADNRERRLLLTGPSLLGCTWVWYEQLDAWVRFDLNNAVTQFIDCPSGVGFVSGARIYVFDEDRTRDYGEREIKGRFTGNVTDLAKYGKKRIFSAAVCCDGDILLECTLDGDSTPSVSLSMSGGAHASVRKRIRTKRFDLLRPSISTSGDGRQIIHSLRLWSQ